jgi:hypothetical protein
MPAIKITGTPARRGRAKRSAESRHHEPAQTTPTPPSLRDWLAGKALEGCEVTLEHENTTGKFWYTPDQLPKRCYQVADAMLKRRAAVDDSDDLEVLKDPRVRRAVAADFLGDYNIALIQRRAMREVAEKRLRDKQEQAAKAFGKTLANPRRKK